MLKARENKLLGVAPPSADLLVCFPSTAHLGLKPKPKPKPKPNPNPICSSAQTSEAAKRHHHLKRINTRATAVATGGTNSPHMWGKHNQIAEPTSPKVTCAGQIKVKPGSLSACRNWQSVMEEIERIHNRGKHKKRSKWAERFGFKKDVMNFLTCLRNIRFDFRCFGTYPEAVITSDDDDDDDDDDEFVIGEEKKADYHTDAVFSKWFMVLQEDNHGKDRVDSSNKTFVVDDNEDSAAAVPPPNALLLMRCRSAPAKSWLEEKQDDEDKEKDEETQQVKEVEQGGDEKKHRRRASLEFLMKYDAEGYKYGFPPEVAQETWVGAEFKDQFSRVRTRR